MAGWDSVEGLITKQQIQLLEEGYVPAAVEEAVEEARRRLAARASEDEIWAPFYTLPMRPDFPFVEPSGLAAIKALRNGRSRVFALNLNDDELYDRTYGAWLGRCVGCALGKPVEAWMGPRDGRQSWQQQKDYLTGISPDEWPIHDYFPGRSPKTDKPLPCSASHRENIAFMETDDDIRYAVLGQHILRTYGHDFRSTHVAHAWMDRLPYWHVCTAETQAYRNIVARYDWFRNPPGDRAAEFDEKTNWHWITHHFHPYREWIGAQIRVDSYGYATPGNPERAAEYAWRDARISHTKNGIYGAMFCAAMIAAAFATNDPMQVVEAGLAEIPVTSRLYSEMRQVIDICARHGNDFEKFERVIEDIYALLGHYSPVHTNNNAGLCVAAVLLSGGDFHRGITFAVMGGWDTDCNGATVGSIVGAMTGARRAPGNWTKPLNDTLMSLIADYHPIAISECARRSVEIARKLA